MEVDLRFRHPFSLIIAGPSKAGKTQFSCRLLENIDEMVTVKPEVIYFCYTEMQPAYERIARIPNVQMTEGAPDLATLKSDSRKKLILLDDMMQESSKDNTLTTLFTRSSHHWDMSCIFLTQNIFYKNSRDSRLSAQYIVLFKNPADRLTVQTLGRQMFPNKGKFMVDAFADATKQPYGYLMLDLTQTTPDELRVRTNIFPGETTTVYLPYKK